MHLPSGYRYSIQYPCGCVENRYKTDRGMLEGLGRYCNRDVQDCERLQSKGRV